MLAGAMLLGTGAASAQEVAPDNGNELATQGRPHCFRADLTTMTCLGIGHYRRVSGDTFDAISEMAIGPNVTIETHTRVVLKDGAFCGPIKRQDLIAGRVRVLGQVISAADARPVMKQLLEMYAPVLNQEICTRLEPFESSYIMRGMIDGEPRPDTDMTVVFIEPGDDFAIVF